MVASFFALVKALTALVMLLSTPLKLDSNPEFTGSALVAYARGIYRLAKHGGTGCYTVFDIPPAWISTHSAERMLSSPSIRYITKIPH